MIMTFPNMKNYLCLILIFLRCINMSLCLELLQFAGHDHSNEDLNLYLSNTDRTIVIDARANMHRYLYISYTRTDLAYDFSYYCIVNKQKNPIKRMQLCCRETPSSKQNQCIVLNSKTDGTVKCNNIEFNYSPDPSIGVKLSYSIAKDEQRENPIVGLFYCTLSNDESSISSNEIEIRDATFYTTQLGLDPDFTDIKEVPPFYKNDMPKEFSCIDESVKTDNWPKWMHFMWSHVAPFEYKICDIQNTKTDTLSCTENVKPLTEGSALTPPDRKLYLVDGSQFKSGTSRALVCELAGSKSPIRTFVQSVTPPNPQSYFDKGLEYIDSFQESKASDKFQAESPINNQMTLVLGSQLKNFYLYAMYNEPEGGVIFKWSKDDLVISKGADKFRLKLNDEVTETMHGIYKLEVESKTNSDNKLEFTYQVDVEGPPQFTSDCLPEINYALENRNYNLSCELNTKSMVTVGIEDAYGKNSDELNNNLKKFYSARNPQLSEFGIEFSVYQENELNVHFFNLKDRQDAKLTLEANNKYGSSKLIGNIFVIPKPKAAKALSKYNCDEMCLDSETVLNYEFDKDLLDRLQNVYNIKIKYEWLINDKWGTDDYDAEKGIGRFITFDPKNPTILKIHPNAKDLAVEDGVKLEDAPIEEADDKKDDAKEKADIPDEATKEEVPPEATKEEVSESNQPSNDALDPEKIRFRRQAETEEQAEDPGPKQEPRENEEKEEEEKVKTLKDFIRKEMGLIDANEVTIALRIRYYVQDENVNLLYKQDTPDGSETPSTEQDKFETFFYDSRYDSSVKSELSSVQYFQSAPATANFGWVAILVIGLLILLAIVILSIYLCKKKGKSHYYPREEENNAGVDDLGKNTESQKLFDFSKDNNVNAPMLDPVGQESDEDENEVYNHEDKEKLKPEN